MLAMSMVVSPWWLLYYFWNEHEVTIFLSKISFLYVGLFVSINAVCGACILRFAPSGNGSLPMYLAAPIALYGFVIGATWIDASYLFRHHLGNTGWMNPSHYLFFLFSLNEGTLVTDSN